MDPNQFCSLNCFLLGNRADQVFTVKILKTDNVSELKDLIKEKRAHDLRHIDGAHLQLWKVSLPIDDLTEKLRVDEDAENLHAFKKISSLFGEDLDDEHVHILVGPPSASHSVAAIDPAQLLSLNCFLLGDELDEAFTVKVLKTENISILKKLIKEEKAPVLDHISASKLKLTQVSLLLDDDLQENLKKIDLAPLAPLLPLSKVFPHVEQDRLHVIIQAPPKEDSPAGDIQEAAKRDEISGLHKRYRILVSNILNAIPPSNSAKSSMYPKSQLVYSIYDGRYKANSPRISAAPPVQLFNPAFGHFLDKMRSNVDIPKETTSLTARYMLSASAIYDNEQKRRAVLNPLLCQILDVDIQAITNADKTAADGIVEDFRKENNIRSLSCLQEDKNEYGDGNSDPSTQTGLSVARCWAQSRYNVVRDATGCPTFLIATAGPWFTVLGSVITDGVIVQRLSDSVWVGLDSALNESQIANVARVFWALKVSLVQLKSFYQGVNPTGNLPAPSRYFPSITSYRDDNDKELVEFEYIGFLEDGPDCVTLRARTRTNPPRDIVVKYVDRYGAKAHVLLANADLAPKLLYCGSPRLADDQPSYKFITMVVMDYVDGDTLDRARRTMDEGMVETVRSEVQRAIELLHEDDLVYGDLRPPNVMVTKDGKVKLIDFNWTGEKNQASYPSLMSQGIAWPEGAQPWALIKPEHDLDMLDKLF